MGNEEHDCAKRYGAGRTSSVRAAPGEPDTGQHARAHHLSGLLTEVSQDGICTDISETGIGFETQAGLYVGEVVYLEFPHQNAVPVRFQARLLYKMGNRYGAYFVSPGSTSNER